MKWHIFCDWTAWSEAKRDHYTDPWYQLRRCAVCNRVDLRIL